MRAAKRGETDLGKELDLGSPGASARTEFERRRENDDRRRKEVFGRFLAPVVKVVIGEPLSTIAWNRGGRGEEGVGTYLSKAVGDIALVLHDRAIPGTRANIDHIAVAPSGVWVIDAKRYAGRVQRRDLGGWFTPCPALFVNGHDRTKLVPAVVRRKARVEQVAGTGVPMHGVLCFADAEWGLLSRPFTVDDVIITWPRRLAGSLRKPGPLNATSIRALATQIASAFPSYGDEVPVQHPRDAPSKAHRRQ